VAFAAGFGWGGVKRADLKKSEFCGKNTDRSIFIDLKSSVVG
jgi:hypothetical protein